MYVNGVRDGDTSVWRVGYVTASSDLRSSDVTAFPSLVELWKHASSETAQALLVAGSVMEELAQPPLGSVPARVPPASIIVVSGYAVRSATTTRPDSIPTAQIDLLACLKRMMRATWASRRCCATALLARPGRNPAASLMRRRATSIKTLSQIRHTLY